MCKGFVKVNIFSTRGNASSKNRKKFVSTHYKVIFIIYLLFNDKSALGN